VLLLDLWRPLSFDLLSFDQQSLYQNCRAMIDEQLLFLEIDVLLHEIKKKLELKLWF
jgi:hypothetical protein